nr:hypothetical protein [Tanacetum cinerariifolium]
MEMMMVTRIEEEIGTITGGMEVHEEMNQLLEFVLTRISLIVNLATLVVLRGYEIDQMKLENELWNLCVKGTDIAGQNVARAVTSSNSEKIGYAGSLRYCNKCRLHHKGPCTMKCTNCKKVGHMVWDCKTVVVVVQTQRAPMVDQRVVTCFGCRGQDSNVVTGTFILKNRYTFILFDSGPDRSFVSTTFSALIDIVPTTLESKEEHEEHLKLILELLKKEELYAKFSKYDFWFPKKELNMRKRKWLELLSDYDSEICYDPRKTNVVGDA